MIHEQLFLNLSGWLAFDDERLRFAGEAKGVIPSDRAMGYPSGPARSSEPFPVLSTVSATFGAEPTLGAPRRGPGLR